MSHWKIVRALGLCSITLGMAMSAGCVEVRIGCNEGLVIEGNRCVVPIDAGTTDVVGTTDRTVSMDVVVPTDADRGDGVGGDQTAADASVCPTGATRCAGACVLLTSDGSNCGTCGNACAAGQSCSAGVCGTVCPMEMSLCGMTCVALGGACTSVGSGECETAGMIVCTAGRAVCSAAPRTSGGCGVPFNGACGAAGVCSCAAGTHLCAGSCVSDTAVTLCGAACTACPVPTGGSATCLGGVCVSACPAGTSACSGACVALTTATNCGTCGVACGAGQTCSGGACVTPACPAGMTLIPAGTFLMGDADTAIGNAQPLHTVTLSAYCMDLTEVTAAAYRGCTAVGCTTPNTGASYNRGVTDRDNHPINGVDWNQARAYCQWRGGDLPTEAQWEYAARGSDVANHIYPWGNAAPASQLCWSGVTGRSTTCAVQSYPGGNSPFGLFDMAGNVWEWTRDFYAGYPMSAASDPTGPLSGTNRVFRGGSWIDSPAAPVRTTYRFDSTPLFRNNNIGFRCALSMGRCGDRILGTGETCDDGNTVSGDGCSATCQSEPRCPGGMTLIPAGTFLMGDADTLSNGAQPPHTVTLSAYCMDLTEVTVAAYRGCTSCTAPTAGTTGNAGNWGVTGRDNHPVNYVDWNQARAYCQSRGGDLPTEAQWEYAARGSDVANHIYPWGNAAPGSQLCWSGVTGRSTTCPVQSYPSGNSPFGLFDMAGNVWEWTRDFYASYAAAAASDPTGPTSGARRVYRGGGWDLSSATSMRAASRDSSAPLDRYYAIGFRCARPPSSVRCGDGVVGAGETCDDGNTVSGDGCSATCQSEPRCPGGMTLIPAGTFLMGDADTASANAQPPHMVTLSAYCMDLTEVTVAAYRLCTAPGCTTPSIGGFYNWGVMGRDNHPINGVDWYQSRAYCQWRDVGGDLPTESQWEYAARGSDVVNHIYPWGNAAPASQLCLSRSSTCPVQSYPGGNSPFGLFDMAGNVWEWTLDFYGGYTSVAASDPTGPTSGTNRVYRGGSWDGGSATVVRAAYRSGLSPLDRGNNSGFRCALSTGRCGDRILGTGETCDDGNTVSGDGCSATCQSEVTCSSLTMATRGGYAEVPDSPALRLSSGSYTIEAWILATNFDNPLSNQIVSKRGPGTGDGWTLGITGAPVPGLFAARGTIGFGLSDGRTTMLRSTQTVPTGRWSHIAVTYDASRAIGRLWIDGAIVGEGSLPSPSATTAVPLHIGQDLTGGSNYPFLGSFDAVRISNTARYTTTFTPPSVLSSDASTIALWNFNETSGAALDGSGNGNHAALLSGATRSNVCR